MKKRILLGCLAVLILMVATGSAAYAIYRPGFVYRVYIDGEDVGTVASIQGYTNILEDLLHREEAQVGLNLKFAQEISAQRELQLKPRADEAHVKTALAARVSYSTMGWAIVVNDESLLWTATREQAQEVLTQVANFFVHDSAKCTLVSTEIVDSVEICPQEVVPEDIWAVDAAVDYILQGREKTETYVVAKGDSLWSVSRSVNMSQTDLKKANPSLAKSNVLKTGQVLNLVVAEPKLNVRTVEQVKSYEAISYSTAYRYTGKRWFYQSSTVTKGVSGKKAVIYKVEYANGVETGRKIVNTEVETQPVTKIIEKGTSRWPSAAAGKFRWPLNTGYITDYFGSRRGTHGGVDIGAPAGTPIYAAAAGTVIISQWGPSYGNYVKIDHGNGYATLYAHASARLVKPGQWVSKGQVIAKVGSTGNSTGPHLHFEVQRNGTRINALQFFKP
ncbi:MAG: M23 family metallopeptidase [Eubacteriales bacterium]|nr:M23 family metallopeptidase [Eubacteriales bacterium]